MWFFGVVFSLVVGGVLSWCFWFLGFFEDLKKKKQKGEKEKGNRM